MLAGKSGRREGDAALPPALILNDPGHVLRHADRGGKIRKIVRPTVLLLPAEVAGEFAGPVRVDEIIAFGVDDINRVAQTRRLPDTVERRAHIDIDDNDAERLAVGSLKLGGDAQRRYVRDFDGAVFLVQIQGRHIYFVRL